MMIEPEELQKRMNHLTAELRRSGVKLTHQRLEIFREVAKSLDHPDVETIFLGIRRRVPTVSLDTVYRTLWLLIDLGLLTTLGPPRGRVRFDANTSSHHHFICRKCGMTRDFLSPKFDRLKIPNAVKALGSVESTRIEIKGICFRCSKKNQRKHRVKRKKEKK
jgi:Fur family peroxide stress response transcriptional regulator